MLPLSLLKTAVGHPVLVELKNGETYNGHLVSVDAFMNMNLKKVICTSRDGDRFWKISACYIRGNTVKYLCIPDEVIDLVPEEEQPASAAPVASSAPAYSSSSSFSSTPSSAAPASPGAPQRQERKQAWGGKKREGGQGGGGGGGRGKGRGPRGGQQQQQQQQQGNSQGSNRGRGGSRP